MRSGALALLLLFAPACAADVRPDEADEGGVVTLDAGGDEAGADADATATGAAEGSSDAASSSGDGEDGAAGDDASEGSSGGADTGSGGAGGPTGTYELPQLGARVYAPPDVHALGPVPVALAFHGAGDSATNFLGVLLAGGSWQEIADAEGLVVVAFDGQTPQTEWTYPFPIPGWDLPVGETDVVRVTDALDYLRAAYDVDGDRVYTLGFSMGATMATSVALALDGEIAAFCAVAQGTPVSDYATVAPASGHRVAGLLQGDPQDPIYASIPYTADLLAGHGHAIELREFPGTGHVGSWMASTVYDPAPAEVWSWLDAHPRGE